MALQIFDNVHFATENGGSVNCTRIITDNADGSTEYNNLKIYRFGDSGKDYDWTSPKRQKSKGNFDRQTNRDLHALALSQVRFGRKGAVGDDTPFVSVATNYKALHDNGEPWVQELLKKVPNLGVFSVPFGTVMRPGINSHATKSETEWLFYDGDAALITYLVEMIDNPYRK
ncbi:MAG: hypothetical protein OEU09_01550 [Rhodospirillales bacterium]|nr:hypothetical protein [Rhodospirillales bacterium]MDH3965585.1 hypothetical protein [Rhodospirillales bacterium]